MSRPSSGSWTERSASMMAVSVSMGLVSHATGGAGLRRAFCAPNAPTSDHRGLASSDASDPIPDGAPHARSGGGRCDRPGRSGRRPPVGAPGARTRKAPSLGSLRLGRRRRLRDRCGLAQAVGRWPRPSWRRHEAAHERLRPGDRQLLEQEAQLLLLGRDDRVLRRAAPRGSRLYCAQRLLAGLVDELGVGLAILALVRRVRVAPGLDLRAQVPRGTPGGRTASSGSRSRGGSPPSRPRGKWWNSSSGSVDAPCWTAPASPYERQTAERRSSVPKSSLTSATPPPGSGTPPCEVPVWTLTLDRPRASAPALASSSRRKPSRYARSSSSVEFCLPTSPISPPIETVSPSSSSARMSAASSAARS